MSDSTSIDNLPTDPVGGGGNMSLTINDPQPPIPTQGGAGAGLALDEATISQIVRGVQQASMSGATSLPSRDIGRGTEQLTSDPHIQPNYIPPAPSSQRDYIQEYQTQANIIDKYTKTKQMDNNLDSMYDEIQTPLMLAVLYFIFQLPIFKQSIFKMMSFLCTPDGNYNLNGLLFVSIMFGLIYHMIAKSVVNFSKF